MKRIIRLTESDLHNIINNAVMQILKEDGALGGANLMVGSDTGPNADESGGIACPFGPVITKGNNLGKKTRKKDKGVDMGPALERGGSISVNHVGSKK